MKYSVTIETDARIPAYCGEDCELKELRFRKTVKIDKSDSLVRRWFFFFVSNIFIFLTNLVQNLLPQ